MNESPKADIPSLRSTFTAQPQMGVIIDRISPGDGVNYPKKLEDGTKFDSSRDRGKSFFCGIGVGQVIQGELTSQGQKPSSEEHVSKLELFLILYHFMRIIGWDEGVPQLSVGEKARLTITGDYAYREKGFPGLIPPNATLIL
ncbi:FK506-binding protein 1 [Endogone sp. FLAS-F59071]|nr:FK506-binding protein 1 [Endogone sp. FLAS-F59071]|eukprot:RUS20659.1 FK506-binding protein 1 [Endogone sp. FLAS-F59071]